MNPIEEQKTLFSRARETMKTEEAQKSNQKSETGVLVSLGLSSLFTIIYLVVALGESLIGIGWSQITAYCIGGLLGLAAIMPGEASVWIWKTKLQSDYEINGTQIAVAWIGGLLAAVSAAVSTVSFFAYMLQGLMPGWYDPNTAAGINIVNIAAGWAVFGIAIFVYYATSDTSTRNKNRAKAVHVARMAIDEMIAGIAQGTKDKIEEVVSSMGKNNVFIDDALDNIGQAMGLSPERQQLLQDHARQTIGESPTAPPQPQSQQQPPAEVRPSARPTPAPVPVTNRQNGAGYNFPAGDYRPE